MNAILNYAYVVLESHVRINVISRGYDPTIGYLHAFEKYRAALVCDPHGAAETGSGPRGLGVCTIADVRASGFYHSEGRRMQA